MLDEGDGLPLGLSADAEYEDHDEPLTDGGRVLVLSDGIIEQCGATSATADAMAEQFGVGGVRNVLHAIGPERDLVNGLFEAVVAHAGTTRLQDDATAVLVKWGG
jgi:serine phosphatase RsbU (regulator of sigma subunit)